MNRMGEMNILDKLLGDMKLSRISSVMIPGIMFAIVILLFYHDTVILKEKETLQEKLQKLQQDTLEEEKKIDKAEKKWDKLEQYHKAYSEKLKVEDYAQIDKMLELNQKVYEEFSNLTLQSKRYEKDRLKNEIREKETWLQTIKEKYLEILVIISIFLGIVLLQISRLLFHKGLIKQTYKFFNPSELKSDYYYIGAGILTIETHDKLIETQETYEEICYASIIPIMAWAFYFGFMQKYYWAIWVLAIVIISLLIASYIIYARKYEFLIAYLEGKGVSLKKDESIAFFLDSPYVIEGEKCKISSSLEIKDKSKYYLKVHPKGQITSLSFQVSQGNNAEDCKNLLFFEIKWNDNELGNRASCLMEVELWEDKKSIPLTQNTFVYFPEKEGKPFCKKIRYSKNGQTKILDDLIIHFKNYKILYDAYPGLEESLKNNLKLAFEISDTNSVAFITFTQNQYIDACVRSSLTILDEVTYFSMRKISCPKLFNFADKKNDNSLQ